MRTRFSFPPPKHGFAGGRALLPPSPAALIANQRMRPTRGRAANVALLVAPPCLLPSIETARLIDHRRGSWTAYYYRAGYPGTANRM